MLRRICLCAVLSIVGCKNNREVCEHNPQIHVWLGNRKDGYAINGSKLQLPVRATRGSSSECF